MILREMNQRERKILAMSLRNARHHVVTSAEGEALLLVQISQDALDEIVRLLMFKYEIGTEVYKDTGDYTYSGWVVSRYLKRRSKVIRYVVENDDGLNFIFPEESLKPRPA